MRFVAAAVVLLMCLSMVFVTGDSMGSSDTTEASVSSDEYVRVGWLGSISSWNPLTPVLEHDFVACHLMHSALFTYDQDWAGPVDDLAMGYTQYLNPDGTMTTIVNITSHAYFRSMDNPTDTSHPLTAEDVAFTFNLILSNPGETTWGDSLRGVTQVVADGDHRVWITTDSQKATLIDDLAGIPIVPMYVYMALSNPFSDMSPHDLVGSGPFMFEDTANDDYYMFKTAPNYHGASDYPQERSVKVEGIVYILYSNVVNLALAMNEGTVDAVETPDIQTYVYTLGNGASVNVVKQTVSEPGICDVAINAIPTSFRTARYGNGNLHLLDPSVREAILMTLDKDYIVGTLTEGLATKADSVIQPGFWHLDIENELPYSPEAARQLLNYSGYYDMDGDGFLEATSSAYVVRMGLLPVGSELSGIRCQAPDTDPTCGYVAIAWQGWAAEAGIGLIPSIVSEAVMINTAWYQADYDIWVWHWGWGAEPLAGALGVWLTSELEAAGDNCQMPMGPWWYGPDNYTDAPAEWGLTGPYSAYDQNYSLAMETLDTEGRKAIVDKLQQWIHDSYTESPPYYDLGLFAYTDARFVEWGDWEAHSGLNINSGLLWVWFQLEPLVNRAPVFDVPPLDAYTAYEGVPEAFSVAVSDYEGDDLWVNFSFGDGGAESYLLTENTTEPTYVNTFHTYSAPADELLLSVSVTDMFEGRTYYRYATVEVLGEYDAPPMFTAIAYYASQPVPVGITVAFSASAIDPDGGTQGTDLKFTWDWGDLTHAVEVVSGIQDSVEVSSNQTHAWAAEGVYPITVSVCDSDDETGEHNVSLTIMFEVSGYAPAPGIIITPLEPSYAAVVGEPITFALTVSDPDGHPLMLTWSFGDGEETYVFLANATEYPTVVEQTHTYMAEGTDLVLWVSAYDVVDGPLDMSVSSVDVIGDVQREVRYQWHGMFEEPFGEWWDYRHDSVIVSDSYPHIYAKQGDWPGIEAYYSSMQLEVSACRIPEVNMLENPQFLPYFGSERGGNAVIDWHLQYITPEEAEETGELPVIYWYDGWFTRLSGSVEMDSTAAMAVMGITSEELADFDSWWAANQVAFKADYANWMREDADRLGVYSMYEWPLDIVVNNMWACENNGTVVLTYDIISWGMEALMTKWLHEAFMPTEWYFENFSMHAEISPETADIGISTAVVGAVFGWKDISTDQVSWAWRGMLQDCITSAQSDQPSDFNAYANLYYLSMYAGSPYYGAMVPYDYTPGAFNLSEGEELSFEWPDGLQTFIVGDYDYITDQYEFAAPYSEPSPYDDPSNVTMDPALRTLTFEGPMDLYSWSRDQLAHYYLASEWDRLGVLPYGMPWIEFRAATNVSLPTLMAFEDVPYNVEVNETVGFTVVVTDRYGMPCTDYSGTVSFASSDAYAMLPEDYTFTDADAGSHYFEGRFYTEGVQWLTVEDVSDPALSSTVWLYVIQPTEPSAVISYTPANPRVGELVTFSANGSGDPGNVVQCAWSFGDGASALGWEVTHAYLERGEYCVTLTVTYAYGVTVSASETVKVSESGGGVKGVVISENLKPIKDALVEVRGENGTVLGTAITDSHGEFLIKGIVPGSYQLVISRNGYAEASMDITIDAGILDVGTVVLEKERRPGNILTVFLDESSLLIAGIGLLGIVTAGGPLALQRKRTGR